MTSSSPQCLIADAVSGRQPSQPNFYRVRLHSERHGVPDTQSVTNRNRRRVKNRMTTAVSLQQAEPCGQGWCATRQQIFKLSLVISALQGLILTGYPPSQGRRDLLFGISYKKSVVVSVFLTKVLASGRNLRHCCNKDKF